MKSDVSLDYQFTSSIEQVWNALTDSDTLAKWIWDNDFKPVVGHKFQFRTEPNEWWDGIVDSEVLEVDEPHKLSYTWVSAGESTTVTWTLKKGSKLLPFVSCIKVSTSSNPNLLYTLIAL